MTQSNAQIERVENAIQRAFEKQGPLSYSDMAAAAIAAMSDPPSPPKPSEEAMKRAEVWYQKYVWERFRPIEAASDQLIIPDLARLLDSVAADERAACAGEALKVGVFHPLGAGLSRAILSRSGCPAKGEA